MNIFSLMLKGAVIGVTGFALSACQSTEYGKSSPPTVQERALAARDLIAKAVA
jgi:hypothetical protein